MSPAEARALRQIDAIEYDREFGTVEDIYLADATADRDLALCWGEENAA